MNSSRLRSLERRLSTKMSENFLSFKESCNRYLDFICLNTSCHGGNWAMKAKSTKLKTILQIMFILFQFFMLSQVIRVFFFRPIQPIPLKQILPNNGIFPNVTICNQRMFDLAKSKGV